jgi:flagellar protein FliS
MMYQSRGKFGVGSARYQSVDLSSRLEGATPHQLVQIMYEELLKALDAMAFATARGDYVQRGQRQSKALAILTGLETSLDFEKGGEIATGLVVIYREARRLVIAGGRDGEAGHVKAARDMIHEISTAWDAIGQRG